MFHARHVSAHSLVRGQVWLLVAWLAACGSDANPNGYAGDASGCARGSALAGADYDIARSKFAFGSTPMKMVEGTLTRWVGAQGVVAIESSGAALGVMNAGAPEVTQSDWSGDVDALTEHVQSYFVSMGISECQIARADVMGGSLGRTIGLVRALDDVVVVESHAYARFNAHDLTTTEGYYWPAIPAQVVNDALAFRDRLADAMQRADFVARLPAEARGEGAVAIHHSSGLTSATFTAVVSYDVLSGRSQLSFGPDAQPVELPQ